MRIFLLIIIFTTFSATIFPQPTNKCGVTNTSFRVGEDITYVLSYTWFFIWTDVGEAKFCVKSEKKLDRDALHLHAVGFSYSFYDWFFKVRDLYESWVDPVSLEPIYFNRNIYEGGFTKENEYTFDWKNSQVNAREKRRDGPNIFENIKVETCTFDIVTAIYVSRNLNFSDVKPNTSYPISVVLDREVYHVNYKFLAREVKSVKDFGKFNTLKFRVELVAGDVFKEGQYLYVWVTDDANRIPIYVESPIVVGSVRARVSNMRGLRHPLTSKID